MCVCVCVCVCGGGVPSIITKAFNVTVSQFFCHSAVCIINVWGNIK